MSRPLLGIGIGYPVSVDETGSFALAAYEESVRQSVWIILGTAKGERVMRPDFGCGIYDLVFDINSAATAGSVAQAVRDALLAFEPRIDVVEVTVAPDDGGEVLLISVDYQVRATNNAFNLVYPFYLERSAV
ncbi:MAG: T6SS lysozyme-like component TssE [Nitrospira sp.]|jgi:phage baseplate assembly protein W|nr:MAG: T6SS lysozyme-like component TssE [Nitrospira sp.]